MKTQWYIMQHPAEPPIAKDMNDYKASTAKSEELYLERSIDRLEVFSDTDVSTVQAFSAAFSDYAGIMVNKEFYALRLHLIKMVIGGRVHG